jgi:hypothetical protein
VVCFFRYALNRGPEDYIRPAVRISYGTDGGIGYTEVKNMNIWELSIVSDELDKINKEAKRKMK